MAQTNLSGTTIRNSRASIAMGSPIAASSPNVNDVPFTELLNPANHFTQMTGPKEEPGTPGASGIKKLVSGGNFANIQAAYYDIMQNTPRIAGQASTVLAIPGANNFRRSICVRESRNTRKIVTAGWNYVTGQPLTTPTVTTDSFGSDHAARPTRAIPGEWVYDKGDNSTPTQADYPAES